MKALNQENEKMNTIAVDAPTETQLLVDCQHNEAAAWNKFITVYGGLIQSWINQMNVNLSDKDDIRQEILVRLLESLPKYDRSRSVVDGVKKKGAFRSWLKSVVHSKIVDFFTRNAKTPDLASDSIMEEIPDAVNSSSEVDLSCTTITHTVPDGEFEKLQERFYQNIRQKIQELGEEYGVNSSKKKEISNRDLDILYYYRGLGWTSQETAQHLGVSPGTVRIVAARVENALKKLIPEKKND